MPVRILVHAALWCATMVFLAGCASVATPSPDDTKVTKWPLGRYSAWASNEANLRHVEDCLRIAEEYRDLAYKNSVPILLSATDAYWYAEESKRFYHHVLKELEPQNAYAAVSIGFLCLLQARTRPNGKDRDMLLDAAYAMLTQADKKRKGYADAHVYLGEMYALRKEWDKAVEEFTMLDKAGIESSYIHAWWGYALKKQGKGAEARAHFRKAVEIGYPQESASWAREQGY